MKDLLGGKGANLAEMTNIGLPVPPGFTITTEACNEYYNKGKSSGASLLMRYWKSLKSLRTQPEKLSAEEATCLFR